MVPMAADIASEFIAFALRVLPELLASGATPSQALEKLGEAWTAERRHAIHNPEAEVEAYRAAVNKKMRRREGGK